MLSDWSYQSWKNRGGIPNLRAQVFHIVAMKIYLGFLELLNNLSSHQQLNKVHIIKVSNKEKSRLFSCFSLHYVPCTYILQSRSSKYSSQSKLHVMQPWSVLALGILALDLFFLEWGLHIIMGSNQFWRSILYFCHCWLVFLLNIILKWKLRGQFT